jgi:polyisoprenoid-binding protein YceI
MHIPWRPAFLAFLCCALAAVPAHALAMRWVVAPAQSMVEFEYVRNGQPDRGHFAAFTGSGTFDPAAPSDATLELRIDSASIDLDDRMASAFATSAEWFDSATHPHVIYRLVALTPEGDDRYHAVGELTIRGKTRPIETTITLRIGEREAHASGSLRLDRKDYLLGVGPSELFVDIGRPVAVTFDLTAFPEP